MEESSTVHVEDNFPQIKVRLENESDIYQVMEVRKTMEQVVVEQLAKDKDLKARKNNTVIYRVPEEDRDSVSDRNEGDLCLNALNLNINPDDTEKVYHSARPKQDLCLLNLSMKNGNGM